VERARARFDRNLIIHNQDKPAAALIVRLDGSLDVIEPIRINNPGRG